MIFGWVIIALSVFTVATTLLAANGKIEANGLWGIRTPATQRDESSWRRAHSAAAWLLIPGCTVMGIIGAFLIIGNTADRMGEFALLGFLILAVASAFVADRAARGVRTPR